MQEMNFSSLIIVITQLLTWQSVAIFAIIVFVWPIYRLISRLSDKDLKRVKLWLLEYEKGFEQIVKEGSGAVERINRLTILMAESRLLELEITQQSFGSWFTPDKQQRLEQHIDELRKIIENLNQD